MTIDRDTFLRMLIDRQYDRNELEFVRGKFRAKGDTVEIYPSNENEKALRIEFFGDEIERISEINPLNGKSLGLRSHVLIGPNSHYATSEGKLKSAISNIEEELEERIKYFKINLMITNEVKES